MGELLLGNSVCVEPTRGFGLGFRGFASRIHRRLATERGGQSDLRARILKYIVWRCKFLEPEPGLFARRTELVVRSQNHQYLHGSLLCRRSLDQGSQRSVAIDCRALERLQCRFSAPTLDRI